MAAPCARLQLMRGPVRKYDRGRPFNGIVRGQSLNVVIRTSLVVLLAAWSVAAAQDDAWRGRGWCRVDYPPDKGPPPRLNLPVWVCASANEKKLDATYSVYERMNPFFLSGDFDGDGKTDIALWVTNNRTKQLGVIILHRGSGAVFFLGAGNKGDRGADWRGLDQWTLYPKAPLERSHHEPSPPPHLKGDALWFAKSESASFFVYWDGHRYRYYQESD